MSDISPSLRAAVETRANHRCEYCKLSQLGQEATYHVDHVIPRSAGGGSEFDNLALACVSCSLRKWANQSAEDPDTGEVVPLFNPRTQLWQQHFDWHGELVVPLTSVARATIQALHLNRPLIVAIRKEETARGRHPPTAN